MAQVKVYGIRGQLDSVRWRVPERVGISATDLEICIQQSPAYNWGFGGQTDDEIQLTYRIDV